MKVTLNQINAACGYFEDLTGFVVKQETREGVLERGKCAQEIQAGRPIIYLINGIVLFIEVRYKQVQEKPVAEFAVTADLLNTSGKCISMHVWNITVNEACEVIEINGVQVDKNGIKLPF